MTNVSERSRVIVCAVIGVVVAGPLLAVTIWQAAILIGWSVATIALLAWIWRDIGSLDAPATAAVASLEDDSPNGVRAVMVSTSVVSLVAVLAGLHRARAETGGLQAVLFVAAMSTVISSWLLVHTLFTLRYAGMYYGGNADAGIEFPGDGAPDYRDFAYLAFTVGMTYQVSDNEITDRQIRRAVLRHALLSFVFGVAVIASTINVLAGFVG